MMSKNSRFKTAFTLVEISIVILIISIILAATVDSSILVKKYRLSSAQTLTAGSPVNRIPNLIAWYEATSEKSFSTSEARDNTAISTWYDITPQAVKNNATSSGSARPLYIKDCINGLPCLRSDGTDDYMSFDGTALAKANYTIFIVGQRRSGDEVNFFIGGPNASSITNATLQLGYRDSDTLTQDHFGNSLEVTVTAYSAPIPTIHTFLFSTTEGKNYWANGGNSPTASDSAQTTALVSCDNAYLGRYESQFYKGDIAEIIIFKDSLYKRDRRAVESYLGKKWKINVNNS